MYSMTEQGCHTCEIFPSQLNIYCVNLQLQYNFLRTDYKQANGSTTQANLNAIQANQTQSILKTLPSCQIHVSRHSQNTREKDRH